MTNSQVKKGYKQTEIGVIPESWKVKMLKESFTIKSGFAFSSDYFSSNGSILLTPGNFKLDGGLYFNERNTKRYSGNYSANMELNRGDLLVVMTDLTPDCNLLGKPAFVDVNEKLLHNQRIGKIELKAQDVSKDFLYRVFLSKAYLTRMRETATGSTVRHTSTSSICNTLIAFPPTIAEQNLIARALSDTDALIESLEQLLTKKRQIKQGAMQELLTGQRRLKDFEAKTLGYQQSKFGLIPEDWEQIEIGVLIDLLTGFPFSSNSYSESGIRLLRGSNVKRGVTAWAEEDTKYWPSISHEIREYALQEKDIVIAMDGSLVGRSFAMLSEKDLPAVLLQRVARIRANSVDQNFLKEWVCSQYFTDHCNSLKTVTAIPHISPSDIRSFTILKPSTTGEQKAIATILSDMDIEIGAIEIKLTKTRQLKQGMMHELLTGRIRLI